MEIDVNGVGRKIQGVAWRIKNEIIDELRKIPREYDSDDETLNQIEKDLTDEAEELDFIGDILANGTDEEGK